MNNGNELNEQMLSADELLYLNQIIADLYIESDYPKAFHIFLEKLKELVFFEKGDVYFYYYNNDNIVFEDFIFIDWSERDLGSYLNNYYAMDDVLPIVASKNPIMFKSSDLFLDSERKKTQYYSELLQPAGMDYSIEGNLYVSDDERISGIGIHRSAKYDDFSQKDLMIMKLARPHLGTVSRWYHDSRKDERAYIQLIPFLSSMKDLMICIWDFDLNFIDSSMESNDFIPEAHRDELTRGLLTLCKGLRENILRNKGNASAEECRMKNRITIGDRSYFVDVAYSQAGENPKGRFIAIVYDYAGIFSELLTEIKNKFMLTAREFEVLQCMMNGKTNHQIADELYISIPTVKKHLTNIYQKLEIEGKHQLFNVIL